MSDSFMNAFSKGLDINMKMDTMRQQEQVRQLQMMKMAEELQQVKTLQGLMSQPGPAQFRPASTPDPYGLTSGDVQELTPSGPTQFQKEWGAMWQQPTVASEFLKAGVHPENIAKVVNRYPQDKAFSLSPGQVRYEPQPTGGYNQIQGPPKIAEVNIPAEVDTFLMGRFGGPYINNPEIRAKAVDWFSSPEGRNEYNAWWEKRKTTAPPIYNMIQTPQGYQAVNIRNPKIVRDLGIDRPLSQSEENDLSSLLSLKDSVSKVRTLFNKNYVGPVAGRAGKLSGSIEALSDEKQQAFYAASSELRKTLFDLGGKQLTLNEVKVLEPFIPNDNDSPTTYKMKLKNFEMKYNNILKNKARVYKSMGYGQPTTVSAGGANKVGRFTIVEEK